VLIRGVCSETTKPGCPRVPVSASRRSADCVNRSTGQAGIVPTVEPVLGEGEVRIVVRLLADRD